MPADENHRVESGSVTRIKIVQFQITELKAKNFTSETEMRNKMKLMEKEANDKMELLTSKVKSLQKELATLSKSTGNKKLLSLAKEKAEANSGSGTDSPSIN